MPRSALPKICVALGFNDPGKLLEHARAEAAAGEPLLEFRLDFLNQPERGPEAVRQFLREFPDCSLLATCRRHQNHGRFNGSIEEQFRILSAAVDAGARAVDVEIETMENGGAGVRRFDGRALLVLSYHNYEGTPALEPIVKRMLRHPAGAYKIVTTARKPTDNWRLLSLARSYPKTPFILLAMGETGFPTRVLSSLYGGVTTYATPASAAGTAAGQVAARVLRHLYRLERLTKNARVYGVIADPVQHSISPAVHNRALQSRRLDAVYLPWLVAPLQLKDFFALAAKLPIQGFSVTIPHKQRILRYLDAVDPLARRIGAVNTVWRKAGKWRGTNTDVEGVLAPLRKRTRIRKDTRVLIAGNGGAARSAAFALAEAGAQIAVVGRNADRVRALAKMCDAEPLGREQAEARDFDVLINATPLGMWPHVDESFFPGRVPARLVFDMVYTPRETKLLRLAREQGAELIPGLEMFLEQAAAQFEIFTGETAPRAAMMQAAEEALDSQQAALAARERA